ncbi:unnamed protein product [Choristocarpus tenellus]
MREQLPTLMRQMADPQNMQAIMNMQSAMQQLQRSGLIPAAGTGGMGGVGAPGMAGLGDFANLNLGGAPPAAPTGGLDFSALLGGGGSGTPGTVPGQSTSGVAPVPQPAAVNPEETYASQITQMSDMGFTDRQACIRALVRTRGNVNAAVEQMLGGGV